MKIRVACLDQERLWAVDDISGSIYSIHCRSLEAKCEIDYRRLLRYGQFCVEALLVWKEEYIVIVPLELDRDWLLYNKRTGELEPRRVMERRAGMAGFRAGDWDRSRLYFFPAYETEPAFIVDFDSLQCTHRLEGWCGGGSGAVRETAWAGACDGRYVFYPRKNGKMLVRLDCETGRIDRLEPAIPEGLAGVGYGFGELWVLPAGGNKLYQIDENSSIVNTAELSAGEAWSTVSDFARVVVQERYLFLLPCYRRGIYVYDKQERKTHLIPGGSPALGEETHCLRYWAYYVRDGHICFLPLLEPYIEIDLSTLAYAEKTISCPDGEPEQKKAWDSALSHAFERGSILWERGKCDLDFFSEYTQHRAEGGNFPEKFSSGMSVGGEIWDTLTG